MVRDLSDVFLVGTFRFGLMADGHTQLGNTIFRHQLGGKTSERGMPK